MKRTVRELVARWTFLIVGLFIMAFGIALSIVADLGTSPLSSPPYVLSCVPNVKWTVGNLTIMMHCIFIISQILILRKKYQVIQLLQLPVAFIFGYMNDFALYIVKDVCNITYNNYAQQWILCMIGIVLVAIGVSAEIIADVVTLAGEGIDVAISQVTPIKFETIKVIMDVALATLAAIFSWLFLGKVVGVREGTLASAILVGVIVNYINIPLGKLDDWFKSLSRKEIQEEA